jgi:hypothetical protein
MSVYVGDNGLFVYILYIPDARTVVHTKYYSVVHSNGRSVYVIDKVSQAAAH